MVKWIFYCKERPGVGAIRTEALHHLIIVTVSVVALVVAIELLLCELFCFYLFLIEGVQNPFLIEGVQNPRRKIQDKGNG